jgi:putative hydrolase of the HAD superfamily
MVRGILFDLDGTLFDRDAAVRELVVDQHLRFAVALSDIPRETYVARVLDLDAHGHGDKTAAYQQVELTPRTSATGSARPGLATPPFVWHLAA